ncbi:MAG: hypothetical protein H7296_05120 [Bacteroidia bacterium]|nr:hypothetical protein [Bacteroidia bacterium]
MSLFAGMLAGGITGVAISLATYIPYMMIILKILATAFASFTCLSLIIALANNILLGEPKKLLNAIKILAGFFYLESNNQGFFLQVMRGISRFTWELMQTITGNIYCQLRNAFGGVDKVVYFGGASFSIKESGDGSGISLGNNIQANIPGAYNKVAGELLLMHEYGHTFDSMRFGILYLPVPGLASLISAYRNVYNKATGICTHDSYWTERRANRFAARYFKRCGINWTDYDTPNRFAYYPRYK